MKFSIFLPARYTVLLLLVIWLFGSNNFSQTTGEKNSVPVYKVVFIKNIFSQVNINDATAALKIWVNELGKSVQPKFRLDVVILDKIGEIENIPDRQNIALINLGIVDYLEYRDKLQLQGVFVPTTNGNVFNEYILLTSQDVKSFSKLKNKIIGIQSNLSHQLPNAWIELLLKEKGFPSAESFFKEEKQMENESQLILALFFGRLDACIVTKNTFDLMGELNPQIKKKLTLLEKSPEVLFSISSFIKDFSNIEHRNLIKDVAQKVNQYPSGKQIMTLTNTQHIAAYKEEYLFNVKKLLNTYKSIRGKAGR